MFSGDIEKQHRAVTGWVKKSLMTRESELKSLINILHLSFTEIDFDALLRKEQIIVSRGTLKMKKFSNLKFLDILFLD